MKKIILSENILFYIGQNAQENWDLLDESSANDLFFHLSSFSSAYGILKVDNNNDNNTITKEIILECGRLIKFSSIKTRNLSRVSIDYTKISNTKKGDFVGEIIYKKRKLVQKIII